MTLPLMKETTIIAMTKPTRDTMDQDMQSPATTSTCSIYDREPSPHVLLQFPIKKYLRNCCWHYRTVLAAEVAHAASSIAAFIDNIFETAADKVAM